MKHSILLCVFLFFPKLLMADYAHNIGINFSIDTVKNERSLKQSLGESLKHQKTNKDSVQEDKEFDIQLFSGTNLDPGNANSAITNFSFEGVLKGKITENIFFRLGGYSNRNFSRDSASGIPQIRYIRLNPNERLMVDTSRLAVQRYQLDSKVTTRSVGFYFDCMYKVYDEKMGDGNVRVFVALTPELVIRRREPEIKISNSTISDTILFTSQLKDQRITTISSAVTSDNIYVAKTKFDQGFMKVGPILEIRHQKYELFFYPSISFVMNRKQSSFSPLIRTSKNGSLNAKILANAKLIGVQFGLDAKGILSNNAFYNLSIGIPIGLNSIKDRLEKKDS